LAPRHPLCALCSLINLFRSREGPEILLITETLGPGHLTFPVVFSDSALKVVLTYYPVCRFQRTSGAGTFRATKKLNLAPTIIHVSVHHAGTKLSSNLQSQNMQEPTLFVLRLRESRFGRGSQSSGEIAAVKSGIQIFFWKVGRVWGKGWGDCGAGSRPDFGCPLGGLMQLNVERLRMQGS